MKLLSVLFPVLLTTLASAKTIYVTATIGPGGKGSLTPNSIQADVGDSIEISGTSISDKFTFAEGQLTAPCSESETHRITFGGTPGGTTCSLRRPLTRFTIPDSKPIIIFSAVDGQCLNKMVLDINFSSSARSSFLASLDSVKHQEVFSITASGACIERFFNFPVNASKFVPPSNDKLAQQKVVPTQVLIGFIALALSLVGLIIGGIALCLQKRERRAKFAYFKNGLPQPYQTQTQTNIYPFAGAGENVGYKVDAEHQPLTASNAQYGYGR